MGTTIRPELSEKNPYWIERHRYYELKHFCLQYPIWKKAYAALDGLSRRPSDLEVFSKKGEISDPTVRCVEARSYYIERMKTEEIVKSSSGKGFKVAAGVGLAVLAGVVIYKYVGKPMIAKIKAQKEQQIIDAEWEDSDEPNIESEKEESEEI